MTTAEAMRRLHGQRVSVSLDFTGLRVDMTGYLWHEAPPGDDERLELWPDDPREQTLCHEAPGGHCSIADHTCRCRDEPLTIYAEAGLAITLPEEPNHAGMRIRCNGERRGSIIPIPAHAWRCPDCGERNDVFNHVCYRCGPLPRVASQP